MKKKMERKGRPRSFPAGSGLSRSVLRFAASVLAGCMIMVILLSSVPVSLGAPGTGVYAAETASAAASLSGTASSGTGENGKEEEKTPAGSAADSDSAAVKQDKEAQDPSGGKEDQADEGGTQGDGKVSSPEGADAAQTGKTAGETAAIEETDDAVTQTPAEEADKQTQPDAGEGKTAREAEVPGQDAAQDAEAPGQDGTKDAAQDTSTQEDSAEITDLPREGAAEDETDGSAADASGKSSSAAQTTPAAADTAAAAATQQEAAQEEPWMTVSEFRRALSSVTTGAEAAGGYMPVNATIVSKDAEIDYEKLGIGKDVSGHRGHTTPINIEDRQGHEFKGICVVPDDRGLAKWSVLPDVKRVTDAVMIKLYYYTMLDSYGNDLAKGKGFSNYKSVAIAACHEAMSMRYAELAGVEYDRPNIGSNLRSLVTDYRKGASAKALPDLNKVHVYISARTQSNGHWMQAYVFGFIQEDETTNINLKKVSSDPDMRATYSQYYCLHETANGGKVYFRIYKDKACTKKAAVYTDRNMTNALDEVPVGMNGKVGLWNSAVIYCPSGTYYLKEVNTPKGYQEHKEPFGPYTIEEGKGMLIKIPNTPVYAKAGIIKKDVNTGKPLAGAKYGLYSDIEDARNEEEPSGVFTTGADGKSNLLEVLAGKEYYVREITAPAGYKKNTGVYALKAADSLSATVWTELTDVPDTGKVRVKKTSSDPAADTESENSLYSLKGARYTLYDEKGASVGTLDTQKDGTSGFLTVPCGSYVLKETSPSPGFALDTTEYHVTVTGGSETTVESTEPVLKGKITVHKVSSEEKEEKAADTLPIKGAIYSLYNSEDDAKENRACAGTFVIGEDGSSNTLEVIAGKTYYVKETKTPEGYLPDEKIHPVTVDSLTETFTVESEEQLIFGGVKVGKRDLETKEAAPLGGASLEGTIIKIYNDGDFSVYADGKKVLPGAEAMTLVTGADGKAVTGARSLSYGSYRAEETLAPEGYTREGAEPVSFKITEDGKITDLSASADTSVKNRVMRGDFSIRKINGYTQKRMAGVTFEVTSLDRDGKEIEKHRFTTDANGFFESTAAWAAQQKQESGQQDGQTAEKASERIWFGVGTKENDALGALPFGSYHIEEIEGENNRGMKMFADDFSIYADGQMLTLGNIENTMKPVLETELLDENGDHFADQKGIITLTDNVTYGGMEEYIGKEVTFHGVIYVKETGKPLQIDGKTVESVQMRKILSSSASVQLRFTFDASKAEGMTLVCFEYASESVSAEHNPGAQISEGGSKEYHDSTNGGKDIVSHTDIDDASQTVHLVSIETDARDQLTGMHIGQARGGAVTVDHVTCRGLTPGAEYLVTGILVDKANGRPLTDATGVQVTAKASFKAAGTVEVVDLTFTYDASLLEGTTVVAFEKLYFAGKNTPDSSEGDEPDTPQNPDDDTPETPETPEQPDNDTPIAVHEDPDDEDQSIHYPEIRTNASAGKGYFGTEDTSNDGGAAACSGKELMKTITADGKLTVCDRVSWKNLIPGRTYRLQGTLMDKADGKPFAIDGENVTAQAQFTPKTKDGDTYLYFNFDAAGLFGDTEDGGDSAVNASAETEEQGRQIVAFEELSISGGSPEEETTENDPSGPDPSDEQENMGDTENTENAEKPDEEGTEYLVAEHKDLQDPAQTVVLRKPQNPEEPEIPVEPENPETPETPVRQNPAEPETAISHKKKVSPASPETVRTGTPVKTGDDTNIGLYLIPAALSALAIAGILAAKRHRKEK